MPSVIAVLCSYKSYHFRAAWFESVALARRSVIAMIDALLFTIPHCKPVCLTIFLSRLVWKASSRASRCSCCCCSQTSTFEALSLTCLKRDLQGPLLRPIASRADRVDLLRLNEFDVRDWMLSLSCVERCFACVLTENVVCSLQIQSELGIRSNWSEDKLVLTERAPLNSNSSLNLTLRGSTAEG